MKYLAFKCRFETTQATNKKTGPDQQVVHIKRMYVYVQTSNTSLNQIALLMPTHPLQLIAPFGKTPKPHNSSADMFRIQSNLKTCIGLHLQTYTNC
jgi:hypothetical protein